MTIAREYGSGGSDIGRKVAELLGWMCVDKRIIERVSAIGKVEPSWAEKADEHASAWWERVMKSLRKGGLESYVGEGSEFGLDRDTLATPVVYLGLRSYRAIGVAWLMHAAWDLPIICGAVRFGHFCEHPL